MNVVVFASGGGGNLQAAINLSLAKPHLLKVGLVVTDRLGIPAIEIARQHKIAVLAYDFEKECGVWADCRDNPKKARKYYSASILFHNRVLQDIRKLERKNRNTFDLAVLSYHRWIYGELYKHFEGRMINQHAGDLTIMNDDSPLTRKYIGINPVLGALKSGENRTRTSTFLVRENHDGGEILCQGPWVTYRGPRLITKKSAWKHEVLQKKKSDWPSLSFALTEIAQGNYAITNKKYKDGCHILTYKKKYLPYGGVNLELL